MIGVAVIGCGYWGPNLIRNLGSIDDCEVRAICDQDPAQLEILGRLYPAVRRVSEASEVIGDPTIDAVAICTPTRTHFPLAQAALEAGKHVLLEKPFTASVDSARQLIEIADARGLVLHVDHTFVHTGAVRRIREMIDAGEIGDLLYLDLVRINLGLFQSDVNVVWDLAPHDVSIVTHLVDREPVWVSAIGATHYGKFESQAYLTIQFGETLLAHVHVNWLAPVKIRSTLIGGSKRMIVYDDLAPSEKVRVYDKGVELTGDAGSRHRALVDYRVGDMFAPYIDKTEPLRRVCASFLEAITSGTAHATDGVAGLAVVRVLEAAQRSIRKDGERIFLEQVS